MRTWRTLPLTVALWAGAAWAWPWMLRNDVTACAACHVDPSGGGQLTAFGRTESEQLVRFLPQPPGTSTNHRFLWFLELPDAVNLSGNVRFGALVQPGAPRVAVPLEMATDLAATFTIADRVVLHGVAGFGRRDVVAPAIVAPACDPAAEGECGPSFLSRTWWAGLKLADGAVLLRAGRLVLPFGLRNAEHNTWVRALTLTDLNVNQKLGAAASYVSGNLRAEVMGIAGATLPAAQEGGYSALAEYAFSPRLALGASSLVASGLPVGAAQLVTRHAHGAFFRWAPVKPVVLLAEADLLAWAGEPTGTRVGYAALAQADWEVTQGLHLMLTAESAHRGTAQAGPSLGAWASVVWYFFSHFELRLDNVLRRTDAVSPVSYALVAQLHLYL